MRTRDAPASTMRNNKSSTALTGAEPGSADTRQPCAVGFSSDMKCTTPNRPSSVAALSSPVSNRFRNHDCKTLETAASLRPGTSSGIPSHTNGERTTVPAPDTKVTASNFNCVSEST